jgi:hypothetical protein
MLPKVLEEGFCADPPKTKLDQAAARQIQQPKSMIKRSISAHSLLL